MKHQPIFHERCNRTNGRPRRSIGRARRNSETQVTEAAGKCKACLTRTRRDEAPARGHGGRHIYCTRGHIRNCHCIRGNDAARIRALVRVLRGREGGCVTASRRSHTKGQSIPCGGKRPGQLRFHYRLPRMVNLVKVDECCAKELIKSTFFGRVLAQWNNSRSVRKPLSPNTKMRVVRMEPSNDV